MEVTALPWKAVWEGSFFNYCRARGEAAPYEHGECANLVFGRSSLWVAASQLQAALQTVCCPGSSTACTMGFIASLLCHSRNASSAGILGRGCATTNPRPLFVLITGDAQLKGFLLFLWMKPGSIIHLFLKTFFRRAFTLFCFALTVQAWFNMSKLVCLAGLDCLAYFH